MLSISLEISICLRGSSSRLSCPRLSTSRTVPSTAADPIISRVVIEECAIAQTAPGLKLTMDDMKTFVQNPAYLRAGTPTHTFSMISRSYLDGPIGLEDA